MGERLIFQTFISPPPRSLFGSLFSVLCATRTRHFSKYETREEKSPPPNGEREGEREVLRQSTWEREAREGKKERTGPFLAPRARAPFRQLSTNAPTRTANGGPGERIPSSRSASLGSAPFFFIENRRRVFFCLEKFHCLQEKKKARAGNERERRRLLFFLPFLNKGSQIGAAALSLGSLLGLYRKSPSGLRLSV